MRVYVDTNVVYLMLRPPPAEHPHHAWVREWRDELASARATPILTPLVADELTYRLLLAALGDAGSRNPLAELRENAPTVIEQHGARVSQLVESVLSLPGVQLVPIDGDLATLALEQMRLYRLLPRDAMHVAAAVRAGCDALLSIDADFARSSAAIRWIGPSHSL